MASVRRRLHTQFQTSSSTKLLRQSKPNFMRRLIGWKFFDGILVAYPIWLLHPYMVKTFQKSPKTIRFPRNLVCSIEYSCPSQFVHIMTPRVTLTYFTTRFTFGNIGFPNVKGENSEFSCHLKVGQCRQLIDFMKYVSIEEQCHFLTLAQCHVHTKIQIRFPQIIVLFWTTGASPILHYVIPPHLLDRELGYGI